MAHIHRIYKFRSPPTAEMKILQACLEKVKIVGLLLWLEKICNVAWRRVCVHEIQSFRLDRFVSKDEHLMWLFPVPKSSTRSGESNWRLWPFEVQNFVGFRNETFSSWDNWELSETVPCDRKPGKSSKGFLNRQWFTWTTLCLEGNDN